MRSPSLVRFSTFLIACAFVAPLKANAQNIALQNATATFSQPGYLVSSAINGTTADDRGWAILDLNNTTTSPQTAVFETVTNAGFVGGTQLTFILQQFHSNPGHLLGRFRLSVTQDDRSTFADGLQSGGDVTANWTILAPLTLLSANGATLTTLGDNSILSSGSLPNTDTYTIVANTSFTNISGFRIEALADLSLPTDGPGRFPANGNFVVSEFSVSGVSAPTTSAAPEPGSLALLLPVMGSVGMIMRRRKK